MAHQVRTTPTARHAHEKNDPALEAVDVSELETLDSRLDVVGQTVLDPLLGLVEAFLNAHELPGLFASSRASSMPKIMSPPPAFANAATSRASSFKSWTMSRLNSRVRPS
jgi:hypothetical protein